LGFPIEPSSPGARCPFPLLVVSVRLRDLLGLLLLLLPLRGSLEILLDQVLLIAAQPLLIHHAPEGA